MDRSDDTTGTTDGSTPAPWPVVARNLSEHSSNPIHPDAGAQAAGFPAALVAGVTTYAYLTHPIVAAWGRDGLEHGGAGRNPNNRLDVDRTFEVRGTRSGEGRLYASGAMTLGGYYAGVDSFLGLQYAALQIVDDLAAQGFCRKIGVGRSISQWWRWARNVAP